MKNLPCFPITKLPPKNPSLLRPSRRRRGVSFCATEMTLLAAPSRRHPGVPSGTIWYHLSRLQGSFMKQNENSCNNKNFIKNASGSHLESPVTCL